VATVESDVYMVGSLAYELLTGGTPPFHWLLSNPQLLTQRLVSTDPVDIPDSAPVPGLLHANVLEALALSKRPVPWCVQANGTPGSAGRLEELKVVMGECLAKEPGLRPKLPTLFATLEDLLGREAAEGREVGSTGGGGSGSCATVSSVLPPAQIATAAISTSGSQSESAPHWQAPSHTPGPGLDASLSASDGHSRWASESPAGEQRAVRTVVLLSSCFQAACFALLSSHWHSE
jgi:hypothetical protein